MQQSSKISRKQTKKLQTDPNKQNNQNKRKTKTTTT